MELPQIGIVLFGCSAIWLVGRKENWQRWGYVLGLCSQPFWFWTSWAHGQWGIFFLSLWYTYAWGQGFYNYWIRK
jgi:hypothetical protein